MYLPADESIAKEVHNGRLNPLVVVDEVKSCPNIALPSHLDQYFNQILFLGHPVPPTLTAAPILSLAVLLPTTFGD